MNVSNRKLLATQHGTETDGLVADVYLSGAADSAWLEVRLPLFERALSVSFATVAPAAGTVLRRSDGDFEPGRVAYVTGNS